MRSESVASAQSLTFTDRNKNGTGSLSIQTMITSDMLLNQRRSDEKTPADCAKLLPSSNLSLND